VLDVGDHAELDAAGFLDVARSGAWWITSAKRPQPVAELAGQQLSFVVLAAGGAGKSRVLGSLREREPDAVEVPLRVLDIGGMNDQLGAAIRGSAKSGHPTAGLLIGDTPT
jgi:hypothetical protein